MKARNYIEVEGIRISDRLISLLKDLQMDGNEAAYNILQTTDKLVGLLLDLNERCESEFPNGECMKYVREVRYYKHIIESVAV